MVYEQITTEQVQLAIKDRAFSGLRQLFKKAEPADIAECLEDLDADECVLVFRLIPKVRKVEVFSFLPPEKQIDLLEVFPEETITFLLNEMEPVDRTQLLEELPEDISSKLILSLEPKEQSMASKLLSYPEDSIGRLMTPEFIAITEDMTVSASIDFIRWNAARYPEEMIHRLFVLNNDGKYIGDVSLGALFTADPSSQPVGNIVSTSFVALSAFDDETVAVDYFRKYDRTFFPVVDNNNVLVGVVMADDVFDVAEEEATEDIQQFGGSAILEDSYFQTPLIMLIRKRIGWLILLFFGGLLSGQVLKAYNSIINSYTYLIFFIPLVVASGGNSGSQSAALIIRGMAIKEIELSDWYKVLFREFRTGISLGSILGSIAFIFIVYFWHYANTVGAIVSFSIIGVVLFGAIAGSMLPFILKGIRLDPAVSSSPLIASLVDVSGIMIFFHIAVALIHHLH